MIYISAPLQYTLCCTSINIIHTWKAVKLYQQVFSESKQCWNKMKAANKSILLLYIFLKLSQVLGGGREMQLKQFTKCFICHLPFVEYLLIKVSFFTCRFALIVWNYESLWVLQEPHEDKYRFNQIKSNLAIKRWKVNYFQLVPRMFLFNRTRIAYKGSFIKNVENPVLINSSVTCLLHKSQAITIFKSYFIQNLS